jgi:hypothetical protein
MTRKTGAAHSHLCSVSHVNIMDDNHTTCYIIAENILSFIVSGVENID